jgi:hypothetical protein
VTASAQANPTEGIEDAGWDGMRGISQAIRQLAWSRGSNLAFFFVRLSSEFANRKIQTSNIVYKVIRSEPFVVVGRGCRKP